MRSFAHLCRLKFSLRVSSRTLGRAYDGHGFYLDLCEGLPQAAYLYQSHRGKVRVHELAVNKSHAPSLRRVFILVGNENQQPCDVLRSTSGLAHHGKNMLQRLSKLL